MVIKTNETNHEACRDPSKLSKRRDRNLAQNLTSSEMQHQLKSSHEDIQLDFQQSQATNPRLVIILSGKRKSGKDHISTFIIDHIGQDVETQIAILRIAGPIKREFSKNNEIDFSRLLDSSSYKENYRLAMVDWSERYRAKMGWNCFLEQAIKDHESQNKPIWLLNDARRMCDLEYFDDIEKFSGVRIIKVRIEASEEVRKSRGWMYTEGIDDKPTECGLDEYKDWTYVIVNNSTDNLAESLEPLFDEIDRALRIKIY